MPQKLCWECAALVHKFNMFRHKCERANSLLQDMYNQYEEVSEQEVLRINRGEYNLISSFDMRPIQVINLVSLKAQSKKCNTDITLQAENTHNVETANAPTEPFVKVELDIKKEEVPIEINSDVDDTELIDDNFVEESCSQAVQLDLPHKIKGVRKKRQSAKLKQKREKKKTRVLTKDFEMKEEPLTQEQQMAVMRERQNTEGYKSARFPCTLCYHPFNMEKAFNNHKLKHDPVSGEFTCDMCKLRHKTRHRLQRHIVGCHMNKYSCQLCSAVFYNRSAALKHSDWHKGVVYTCNVCGISFDKQTSQLNHLRKKHAADHACDQCGEQFHSKKGLRCHINLAHKLKRGTVASGGEQETSGPYCAECDIQFTCKQAWTRHILISPKHQHERHICALGCEACGETLPDEESLQVHRVIHRQTYVKVMTQPITCEQCGDVMESHRAYHAHFRSAHPDRTRAHYPAMRAPCMCELCGRVFPSRSQLKRHSLKHTGELQHTGERRYHCELCSKRFTTKPALTIHIRTHTEGLPYKCDICGQGFTKYGNMKKHLKSVHSDATPYTCDICGKGFKYRGTVKSHFEYVHMKKPWPKRDRSKRQNTNERRNRDDKRKLLEHA